MVMTRAQATRLDLRADPVRGVFCEGPLTGAGARRLRRRLRLGGTVPLVPFVISKTTPGSSSSPPTGGLIAPLDPAACHAVLLALRAMLEARHETRRVHLAARASDRRLKALGAIVRTTGRELDPRRIVEMAMTQIGAFVDVLGFILLVPVAGQGTLAVDHAVGEALQTLHGATLNVGEGILGRAAHRRQVLVTGHGDEAVPRAGEAELPRGGRAASLVAIPLLSRGRLVGVLGLVNRRVRGCFSPRDARLAATLLEPVAVALDSALLLRRSEELSVTDDLTKLYNSRYLNATLRREVERSRRYRGPVSLIFLDLDGFKSVNDQHGHLYGSRTLVEVGAVIRSTVRTIDVVARYGGDEFTVILPQTGREGARTIAERVRERIAAKSFLTAHGLDVRITASFGIASYPEHGRNQEDLLARADQAMYAAKAAGKNAVVVAGRSPATAGSAVAS